MESDRILCHADGILCLEENTFGPFLAQFWPKICVFQIPKASEFDQWCQIGHQFQTIFTLEFQGNFGGVTGNTVCGVLGPPTLWHNFCKIVPKMSQRIVRKYTDDETPIKN